MTALDADLSVIGHRYRARRRRLLVQLAAAMLTTGLATFHAHHGDNWLWWLVAGCSALVALGTFRQLEDARNTRYDAERRALLTAATRPTDETTRETETDQ
ncbi:hypothetical protein [Kribbella solani]|uniref:DUF202 domain-containing protein n=1 Tax=Kribbella solani TaxID=236067 RepID=A0A841DZA8_9ACTN|nr:hypothetical protein [Kribbella solani]MBB5983972.1 hypothetical protein [Kribbella solani]